MNLLKKLWNWTKQNKTCLLLLVTLLVAVYAHPNLAWAADGESTKEDIEKDIATLMSIIAQFLNSLLWPFLLVIGDLMDTDLITGPGMGDHLKALWVPIRDLVNICFVLVLLAVALYNVLGLGGGEGELAIKTALPKIVLGLVLVNFTLPIGRVLLDLVNVATTATFALPEIAGDVDGDQYNFKAVKDEFVINVCYKEVDEATNAPTAYYIEDEDDVPIYTKLFCKPDETTKEYKTLDGTLEAKYFTDLNANNIGLVMAVNMGGLGALSILKADAIDSFSTLTVGIIFSVVMYLVFATTYVVLGIVLLTRIVVLWLALALSPIAVLIYVVPQVKEWAGGGGDVQQKVIKTLIAPVIIGAVMSLGYIMINAWDGLTQNSALTTGGFAADEVISKEFLISGINDLPRFIIAIASVVIVWMGVFQAANSTYADFATQAIEGVGKSVKDFAVKLPLSLPYVPISVPGQNPEAKISPMALKLWADNLMGDVSNGNFALKQLNELPEGTNLFGIPFNAKGIENQNPIAARTALITGSREANIDMTRASQLASDLVKSIRGTENPDTRLLQQVESLKQRYVSGDRTVRLEDLRNIIDRSTAEKLGLEEEQREELIRNLPNSKWSPTNAPTTPNPSTRVTLTSAQSTTLTGVINRAGTGTTLTTNVDGLNAANTALATAIPAATSLVNDLDAARRALADFQTASTPANLDKAKKAVKKAYDSAIAANSDTTIAANPTMKPQVVAAVPETKQMLDDINTITL
jgi:hypothetical protein